MNIRSIDPAVSGMEFKILATNPAEPSHMESPQPVSCAQMAMPVLRCTRYLQPMEAACATGGNLACLDNGGVADEHCPMVADHSRGVTAFLPNLLVSQSPRTTTHPCPSIHLVLPALRPYPERPEDTNSIASLPAQHHIGNNGTHTLAGVACRPPEEGGITSKHANAGVPRIRDARGLSSSAGSRVDRLRLQQCSNMFLNKTAFL